MRVEFMFIHHSFCHTSKHIKRLVSSRKQRSMRTFGGGGGGANSVL